MPTCTYVYDISVGGSRRPSAATRSIPFSAGMGRVGRVRNRDRCLRDLWRLEAAVLAADRCDDLRVAFRGRPQGIPLNFAGPACADDARRHRFGAGGRPVGGEARPTCGPARADGRGAARLDHASIGLAASPDRIWYRVRSAARSGAPRYQRRQGSLRRRNLSRNLWWRFGDYVNLRPGIPLYNAGDTANPIAPNAYNYVISLQRRNTGTENRDLKADFASLGYEQVQCWSDPYSRALLTERTCLWRRAGDVRPRIGEAAHPMVGEAFETLVRPLGGLP